MTKLLNNRYLGAGILVAAILVTALAMFAFQPHEAKANPSQILPPKATAVATTTLQYMSPGAGTTTLSYDALSTGGTDTIFDKMQLVMQYTASSTAPSLKYRIEDSRNGIDWYPRSATVSGQTNATTTQITGNFADNLWTVATTTDNGGSGTSARVMQSVLIDMRMRYIRAIFYVPASGGNGGLWAEFNPTKQKQ